jgi:hypothetical protein
LTAQGQGKALIFSVLCQFDTGMYGLFCAGMEFCTGLNTVVTTVTFLQMAYDRMVTVTQNLILLFFR